MEKKDYAKKYGLRLKRAREARGMSQQDVADRIPTSYQNVSQWENRGISKIENIMELSKIFGQDFLIDERDKEAPVGEIGKHILKQVAQNNGFIPVEKLIEDHMYGLSIEKVTEEIVKLTTIGMCVREQYKNFYDEEKDMLFITAKGLIALNNFSVFGNVVSKTYEQFLGSRSTIQEYYDENKLERIIRNLRYCGTYRIDYINYLHKRYEKIYIDEHENDGCDYGDWTATVPVLPGLSCRLDILFRMIAGLDNSSIYEHLDGMLGCIKEFSPEDEYTEQYGEKCTPRLDEVLGMVSEKIKIWNEKVNEERNGIYEESIEESQFNTISDMINFLDDYTDYFIEKRNAFVEGKYPSEWFSMEEIKEFIKDNFKSAETPEEKETDRILAEINSIDRWSLEYYDTCFVADDDYSKYFCDTRWREAGIEDLIKSYYSLPDINSCIDEQDGDE